MKKLIVKDLEVIDYDEAYALQKDIVKQVKAGQEDHLLVCEHPAVLTLGRMFEQANLLFPEQEIEQRGVKLSEVDRGGDVTLHAPGQLVVYPILNLNNEKDLRSYLRQLEQVVIAVLADYGIESVGSDDQRGVWVGANKIASMGIGVSRWVCYHGVGLNVSTDLELFRLIRPCGLDVQMTSIKQIKNAAVPMNDVKNKFIEKFCELFHYTNNNGRD